jgi:hypothetical protein
MRYLVFNSFCFLLIACLSPYKKLQKTTGDVTCVQKFKPLFISTLYKTQVSVTGKQISGILLFKTMPDSSLRIVFSNEMGFKFFDFEFSANNGFKVFYIMDQLDKKAVIKTLRKDFELVLLLHSEPAKAFILKDSQYNYFAFPQEKGVNYYITDPACNQLLRIEKASKKKPVVIALMQDYRNGIPDTIGISHKNFKFTIGLKRFENVIR